MPKSHSFVPRTDQRLVEIVGYSGAQLLDVCGPLQVFSSANDLVEAEGRPAPYYCCLVSKDGDISTTSGVTLSAKPYISADAPVDTLIIVGGAGRDAASKDIEFIRWLGQRSTRARRIGSVCTGAFLLAEAGLLKGRRATTHWQYSEELRRRYPEVDVDPQSIFIEDTSVWTSGGVTAGIDLSLALVEQDLGRPMALAIAQHLVMFLKRPGGQSQFSTMLSLQKGVEFDRLHEWISNNIDKTLSIDTLSHFVGMSARNFSRRYRTVTGKPPMHAVEQLRVETARRLLEEGVSIGNAVRRCGFGTKERMRRSFLRTLNVGPQAYVERFGPHSRK